MMIDLNAQFSLSQLNSWQSKKGIPILEIFLKGFSKGFLKGFLMASFILGLLRIFVVF